jgi:hypothetical protein
VDRVYAFLHRYDHNWYIRPGAANMRDIVNASDTGHEQIEKQKVDILALRQQRQCLLVRAGLQNFAVAIEDTQHDREPAPNKRVIIRDDYARWGQFGFHGTVLSLIRAF